MQSKRFPTHVDQIDSAWLTAVLREDGTLTEGEVASFAIEPLAEPGQTAEMCRIRLEYTGFAEGAPRSLVAKLPATYPPAREVARTYESYFIEVSFYRLLARGRDLPVPMAHAAEIDPESGDFVLLLEDLSAARNGSLFRSAVNDVATGLGHLARIHGEFWNAPLLSQHAFIRKMTDPAWNAMLKGIALQIVAAAHANFADRFSPYSLSAIDLWIAQWDELFNYHPDPHTLVHIDAHPKQMFFPTERLPRFALFDWQGVAKNWGACDVARLLVTGLSVEDRREHERALVDGYYDALCRHGATGLSQERLWFQIRLVNVWNVYINLIAVLQTDLTILDAAARAEGTQWHVLLSRVNAAIEDWKLAEALQEFAAEARAARGG